jgi:predicted dienelactone hydrolase
LIVAAVLVVLALASGCAGQPEEHAPRRPVSTASAGPQTRTHAAAPPTAAAIGGDRTYRTGERQVTFTEPARTGPAGQHLGQRTLVTQVRYPRARGPAGPFPLLLFAPGFLQCPGAYSDLLRAWASAGYVVAAVTFPRTNCHLGTEANEADLVNQPQDMSYVLTRLLALSTQPGDPFSGLLDPHEVGAAGQSDGGDTVAAIAATPAAPTAGLRPWPCCPGPSGRRCPGGTSPARHRRC